MITPGTGRIARVCALALISSLHGACEPSPADEDTGSWPGEPAAWLELEPVAVPGAIFLANGAEGLLARVRASTLETEIVDLGAPVLAMLPWPGEAYLLALLAGGTFIGLDADRLSIIRGELDMEAEGLFLSPDGRWLVFTGAEGSDTADIALWDLETGDITMVELVGHPEQVRFSQDGTRLALLDGRQLALLSTSDPEDFVVYNVSWGGEPPGELELAPDGSFALLLSEEMGGALIATPDTQQLDILGPDTFSDQALEPAAARWLLLSEEGGSLYHFPPTDDSFVLDEVRLPEADTWDLIAPLADDAGAVLLDRDGRAARFLHWDASEDVLTEHSLAKAATAVAVAGDAAAFAHPVDDGELGIGGPLSGSAGVSVWSLSGGLGQHQALGAELSALVLGEGGASGWAAVSGQPTLVQLDLPGLGFREIELPEAAVHLGVIPGTDTAWFTWPGGPVALVDPSSGELRQPILPDAPG
jgi:hypothetical protein